MEIDPTERNERPGKRFPAVRLDAEGRPLRPLVVTLGDARAVVRVLEGSDRTEAIYEPGSAGPSTYTGPVPWA